MRRLASGLGSLLAFFCIGTVLAQFVCLAYLRSSGYFSDARLAQIAAVLRGETPHNDPARSAERAVDEPTVSLDDVARTRALRSRDLELREQALRGRVQELAMEQTKLRDEKNRYESGVKSFQGELDKIRATAISTSQEEARLILESLKPKQAKDQILRMMKAGETVNVVTALSAMPLGKQAKILAEFKTDEEAKRLEEILTLMRSGVPEAPLVEKAAAGLDKKPGGPQTQ